MEKYRTKDKSPQDTPRGADIIAGRNAVNEALRAGHTLDSLIVQRGEHGGSLSALIAKAKALLMERNNMTEAEAHRYIQKCSMDSGTNLVETAQMVISLIHV